MLQVDTMDYAGYVLNKFLQLAFHVPNMYGVSSQPNPIPLFHHKTCTIPHGITHIALTLVCTCCAAKQDTVYYKAGNRMHAVVYLYIQGQ